MHPSYSAVAIECSLHNVVHCCKSLHSTVQCQILQYSAQLTLCTVHFPQRSAVQCCVAWRDQYWGIHYNDISVSHYNHTHLLFTVPIQGSDCKDKRVNNWNIVGGTFNSSSSIFLFFITIHHDPKNFCWSFLDFAAQDGSRWSGVLSWILTSCHFFILTIVVRIIMNDSIMI